MLRKSCSTENVPGHDPSTPEEWQEAVDAAAACRVIANCKMYGLLQGGPEIDVGRCDELLEQGRARGVHPSKSVTDLGVEFALAYNAAPRKRPRAKRVRQ
jgi:hypothetical protein